ncbi:hypothetical protein ACXYUI_28460, partial [Klebsiella pneumoniae]
VLAALVLPGVRLSLLLLAIASCYVAVIVYAGDARPTPAALAGHLLAVLGPIAIVAWLTSQLGTAVLAARRRAAALTEGDELTGLATRRV